MLNRTLRRWLPLVAVGIASCAAQVHSLRAEEILVVDRLTNSVYRYSTGGNFLGTLLTDATNLNAPDGLVVSPDLSKLYVASSQNNQIVRYDYDYANGTAANPTVIADATNGINFPDGMKFSADGSTLYVANLNGTGIAQLNPDGGNAGPNIGGGSSFAFSGLDFAPGGELLAAGFDGGTVAKSDPAFTSMSDLVAPNPLIQTAAGVLVQGNNLYVTGLFTGQLNRFDATTGAIDPGFNVSGLEFPQALLTAPDGNSLLVGILGLSNGTGNISHYATDGTFLGVFAAAGSGFTEATAFIKVPEPSSLALGGCALATVLLVARRRRIA